MARPKAFDRDEALGRALDLFWKQGYEATSIVDLVDHLGIGRQSLYDTFGDKHALYLEALDRYGERYGDHAGRLAAEEPVRVALRRYLLGVVDAALSGDGRTCMMVAAAAERCPADPDVNKRVVGNCASLERAFVARLERAQKAGELGRHQDVTALARYLVNAVHGLNITAKAMRDRAALEQIVDVTLAVLG